MAGTMWAKAGGSWSKVFPPAPPIPPAPPFDGGLIPNGDFSTPDISGWATYSTAGTQQSLSYDANLGHTAPGSLRGAEVAASGKQVGFRRDIAVQEGQSIDFSFWLATNAGGGGSVPAVQIQWKNAGGGTVSPTTNASFAAFGLSGVWQECVVPRFTVPAGVVLGKVAILAGTSTDASLDDVRFLIA